MIKSIDEMINDHIRYSHYMSLTDKQIEEKKEEFVKYIFLLSEDDSDTSSRDFDPR